MIGVVFDATFWILALGEKPSWAGMNLSKHYKLVDFGGVHCVGISLGVG